MFILYIYTVQSVLNTAKVQMRGLSLYASFPDAKVNEPANVYLFLLFRAPKFKFQMKIIFTAKQTTIYMHTRFTISNRHLKPLKMFHPSIYKIRIVMETEKSLCMHFHHFAEIINFNVASECCAYNNSQNIMQKTRKTIHQRRLLAHTHTQMINKTFLVDFMFSV